jgi:excinuclease ABC subunit C
MEDDLKKKVGEFPEKPGIYFFKNDKKEVIYIGKARSLRDRVRTYFLPTADPKVNHILRETADIDFILTGSEREAAFLENNFVQQYQPKFNLRLKDDKSFPYLKLTVQEKYPGVYFSRKVEPGGARYFGPFSPAHQARQAIHLLSKSFGLRTCTEPVPGKRKRPCLEYDLGLCSAPCVGYVSEGDYREHANEALLFLEGKVESLVKMLREKMERAAERQDFEQAAHYRDAIQAVEQVKVRPRLISVALEDKDIIGSAEQKEQVAIYAFFMRKGKVIESREAFFERKENFSESDALGCFLDDFYLQGERDIPDVILLPRDFPRRPELGELLRRRKGQKVRIIVPEKGKNKNLVELASRNAETALRKKRRESGPLADVQKVLSLEEPPQRIEGFDISNTGGEESVGSLVVFEDGMPKKQEYRKYRIRTVRGPNDVASLEEVLRRRFQRALEERRPLPDLVLVDGGKGQLHTALRTLQSLGIEDIALVSLAKKEEVLFSPKHKEGIRLDRTSPALKLFQSIRDEAHRFAISFHRQRREKKSFASLLDGISGLGPKRKKALFSRYKDIGEIQKASTEELAEVIGARAARALLNHLDKERML